VSDAIQRGKDGVPLQDPFGENKGTMQYAALGKRLGELKGEIDAELRAVAAAQEGEGQEGEGQGERTSAEKPKRPGPDASAPETAAKSASLE